MKKLFKLMLCSVCLVTLFTGCGKAEGDKDVVKSIKDGTYTATETVATNSNSDAVVKTDWTVTPTSLAECEDGIKDLTNGIDKDIHIDKYVGYIVQGLNVKYAFTGLTEDNENRLVYVIQNTNDDSLTYEYPDYSELDKIYIKEIVTDTDATDN